jgi:hypothetical protein
VNEQHAQILVAALGDAEQFRSPACRHPVWAQDPAAARSRPRLKALPSPIAAVSAVALMTPMRRSFKTSRSSAHSLLTQLGSTIVDSRQSNMLHRFEQVRWAKFAF